VSKDQAMAILEKSGRYLNPIGSDEQHGKGKKLSIPHEGASESPRNDGIHDPANDAIAVLQDPTKALARFPRDRRHQVDWVAALDQGLIAPRADLLGESQMQTLDLDIIMKNTQYMPYVRFPHLPHTKWLACSNCHPDIFIPKEDANPISMNKVLRGQYCGRCHDKVAFALFICERCHSVPHEGSGKWW
jgi:c(7)-type cytochrome triheme protein